ncbi:putative MFS myo-inositol transporter [Nadsonia fulvescens var. elongata DSM 6958]|uniref:Putative MFS myo-inositol transporter n=1 Tax=Nadsonia fulvescens var. elongata DSM 6958 TaxID=857566 RepID=A0A1E3PFN7_9ASCO|nr:putative MFS myo-inositol transporter [Nadsonia fulvescens var. elongata DSM 6958]
MSISHSDKPVAFHAEDLNDLERADTLASDDFINEKGNSSSINPLVGIDDYLLRQQAGDFAELHGFNEDRELFIQAAFLARDGTTDHLDPSDAEWVQMEKTHKWRQPKSLYYLTVLTAMCAVVQGMDETVVNGASLFFKKEFNITNNWIEGLVIGAPYLCCFAIGCALTGPLNDWLGRRGVIFLSCAIAAAASIWEAFTYSWVQLFLSRFVLGLGIGPKSTTTPVFAAECAPAAIRGSLVMMWQMWTAFGIMLGYIVSVAFTPRDNNSISESVAWRLMLGSTVVAPLIVCAQVYLIPESPRWYIKKGRYTDAYKSLVTLRPTKLQAARDLFYMSKLIDISNLENANHNTLVDLFVVPRNRRALVASQIVMFMQQFCGINVIAFYSSQIFVESGFSTNDGILASLGFGILNFLFALPAVFTIDTFGRRALTLTTFPFLSIFLLFAGFSFWIPDETARIGCIALGIYLFTIAYSPGMGPVPFTYSAEAFPLHVRDIGMTLATMTLWGFNFILSLTWPPLLEKLGPQGAFGYYAGWNMVGFLLVFFFVPETKGLTLEELDGIFSVSSRDFISYEIKHLPYYLRKNVFRQKGMPEKPSLYKF